MVQVEHDDGASAMAAKKEETPTGTELALPAAAVSDLVPEKKAKGGIWAKGGKVATKVCDVAVTVGTYGDRGLDYLTTAIKWVQLRVAGAEFCCGTGGDSSLRC